MNREKYIKDKSYREGYKDGHKEGIDTVINTYNAYLNRLEEDINYLRERLENIKAESEDKKEGSDKESDFKIVSKNAKVDTCYGLETKNGTPFPKGQGMKLINSEKAIDYAKEKNYIKTSGQEEALREVFALATVEAVPKDVLDKIRAEFEHDNKLRTIETDTAYECGKHANKWIPVSERLPEESLNSVIGWDAYRERCVFVQYIDGYFQITGSDESFDIVAWMPVPEPYEAENDPWEKWLYPNRKENEK